MTNLVLDRTVTQRGDCLTIRKRGYASYHNTRFKTALTQDDLDALTEIISSEVRCAFSQGWEESQRACVDHYYAAEERDDVDWDKLPENPAYQTEEVPA